MVQSDAGVRTEATGPAAERRRREILAAASRQFRARGLHATGMREIAAELGMTAGNLYYYFPSKQDLLAWCQKQTLERLRVLATGVEAGSGTAGERLARLVEGHVRILNQETPGSLAHLEVNEVPDARRREILDERRRYEAVFTRLIEAGIAAGEFRPLDARLATLALLGALNWTVKWFHEDGARSAEEVGRSFAELLIGGLAAGSAR